MFDLAALTERGLNPLPYALYEMEVSDYRLWSIVVSEVRRFEKEKVPDPPPSE
jgi:hypothetical protein